MTESDNQRLSGDITPAAIAALYGRIHTAGVGEDAWHAHTTKFIGRFVAEHTPPGRVLDVGAGRIEYGCEVIALDLTIEALRSRARACLASAHELPIRTASLDAVWCVGSVINYLLVSEFLHEARRVLRREALLILEYERLISGPALVPVRTEYLGEAHVMWLFRDEYIAAALRAAGLRLEYREHFHLLPPRTFSFLSWSESLAPGSVRERLGRNTILCARRLNR